MIPVLYAPEWEVTFQVDTLDLVTLTAARLMRCVPSPECDYALYFAPSENNYYLLRANDVLVSEDFKVVLYYDRNS